MTKIVIDLEKSIPPEGYEFTGEYRHPEHNEWFLERSGNPYLHTSAQHLGRRPILRKKRWRANHGEEYWFVDTDMVEVDSCLEFWTTRSEGHYKTGNYFRTEEKAQIYLDRVMEVFKDD